MQAGTLPVVIAVVFAASTAGPAGAQSLENRGSVVGDAPIYLLPDRARQPLCTAAGGTILAVVTREEDWTQVRFRDPEFGPRVGFIESRHLNLATASDTPTLGLSAKAPLQRKAVHESVWIRRSVDGWNRRCAPAA